MALLPSISTYDAFQKQLKTLCLNEFPCGIGTWKEHSGKKRLDLEKDKVRSHFAVTLVDFGANHEKTENLKELVHAKHSPWNQDYSWSDEAKTLRELAVKSPWLIDEKFVLRHFQTLRILDKGVTEVDSALLHFTNLRELTLSANHLQSVDSRSLPANLQVLELCANEIRSLDDLCICPPPLTHLGLGHNQISSAQDYITGEYWPHLLSLDLSHNNLVDLMDIIRKLQTLPKLRNLLLQGNPIALVPGYRGYTIDSLKYITYLDDINISADERHHFKGLAKKKEYILDEAKTMVRVLSLKNLPMPEELKFPDDQPEYPVVTRRYFVRFLFLEDKSSNAEIFQIFHDEDFSDPSATQRTAFQSEPEGPTTTDRTAVDDVTIDVHPPGSTAGGGAGGLVYTAPSDGSLHQQTLDHSAVDGSTTVGAGGPPQHHHQQQRGAAAAGGTPLSREQPAGITDNLGLFLTQDEKTTTPGDVSTVPPPGAEGPPGIPLKALDSEQITTWKEGDLEYSWQQLATRDDLLSLRNFFRDGVDIEVVEEKIQSVPADQLDQDSTAGSAKGAGGGAAQKGAGGKKGKEEKGGKDKGKEKGGGDDKKKKKKGEPEVEMVDLPSEFTTLATFHVDLKHFTEGEFDCEESFSKEMEERPARVSSAASDKKKKPSSAKKKDKERAKSPKGDKKDKDAAKGKGGKRGSVAVIHGGGAGGGLAVDEDLPPPPPLQLSVSFHLVHWTNAMDCYQAEQQQANDTQVKTPDNK